MWDIAFLFLSKGNLDHVCLFSQSPLGELPLKQKRSLVSELLELGISISLLSALERKFLVSFFLFFCVVAANGNFNSCSISPGSPEISHQETFSSESLEVSLSPVNNESNFIIQKQKC